MAQQAELDAEVPSEQGMMPSVARADLTEVSLDDLKPTTLDVNGLPEDLDPTKEVSLEVDLDNEPATGEATGKVESPTGHMPKLARYCKSKLLLLIGISAIMLAGTVAFVIHATAAEEVKPPTEDKLPAIQIVDDHDAVCSGPCQPALVGQAPFFHNWFGNVTMKAFHHDAGRPRDLPVAATYVPKMTAGGCYELHEWHPSGPWSQMTVSASLEVKHSRGLAKLSVDQSSNGGQWNYLASFYFEPGVASVFLSNHESRCSDGSSCYTSFDAFRFVPKSDGCGVQVDARGTGAKSTYLFGSLLLDVADSKSFIDDDAAVAALKKAMGKLAGVSKSAVQLSFSEIGRQLSVASRRLASVSVSFRISMTEDADVEELVAVLKSKSSAVLNAEVATALEKAGSPHKVTVKSITTDFNDGTAAGIRDSKTETTSAGTQDSDDARTEAQAAAQSSTVAEEPSKCMSATIVNDFDSKFVTATVSPGAMDMPEHGLEAFRPGRIGEKPYFHGWFGQLFQKDFHHDAHTNKGLLRVNYTKPLPTPGCYLLEEWHTGGSKFCLDYMPRKVPFHVHDARGTTTVYGDQSVNGGQWNPLGLFEFKNFGTVIMSNEGTDNCENQGLCYTVFDSLRFVHAGDACGDLQSDLDSLHQLSDLACDDAGSLAHLRSAPTGNDGSEFLAETSPSKLLEVLWPEKNVSARAGDTIEVSWKTEGVGAGARVKLSLYHDDLILHAIGHKMKGSAATIQFPLPSSKSLNTFSNVQSKGISLFRIRIDVEDEVVDLSNGWSNQLHAFSPNFTVHL